MKQKHANKQNQAASDTDLWKPAESVTHPVGHTR